MHALDRAPEIRSWAGGIGIRLRPAVLLLAFLATTASAADYVCTDCHNPGGAPLPHTDGCRDTSCLESCHAKDLNRLRHPTGPGTPLKADRTETCHTCHNKPFEGVYHPYTINVNAASLTQPGWVDLDQACGQCHGGGTDSGSNPPTGNAGYMTKAQLASLAVGIHDDKPAATFGYTLGNPNTLLVNVDASGARCFNVCDAYDWNWGDGSPHGTGVTASHTYAPGTYQITLTVTDTGMGTGTFSQSITAVAPDLPPVVAGECTFDANTWTETVSDASTDDRGVRQVTVNWGDGSVIASDTTAPFGPFTRTYANVAPASPGYYTITHKAIDTIGQSSTRTCTAAPAYFVIGGVVKSRTGANLGTATVTVKKGTTVVRTVYTASNGTFSVGTLKPGTYTLTVTKAGYTFTVPAATVTVGPSKTDLVITATAP